MEFIHKAINHNSQIKSYVAKLPFDNPLSDSSVNYSVCITLIINECN